VVPAVLSSALTGGRSQSIEAQIGDRSNSAATVGAIVDGTTVAGPVGGDVVGNDSVISNDTGHKLVSNKGGTTTRGFKAIAPTVATEKVNDIRTSEESTEIHANNVTINNGPSPWLLLCIPMCGYVLYRRFVK